MQANTTLIKKAQGKLGVVDDGKPGKNTFTALALAVGINAGQYRRSVLVAEIAHIVGYEGTTEDDGFWLAVIEHLDAKDVANSDSPANDFFVLEIPSSKTEALPTTGLIPALVAKTVAPLVKKFTSGWKSKGTFTTGLSSALGGVILIGKAINIEDAGQMSALILAGANALIAGFGLMFAREANVSDEKAGAKKLENI